MEECKDEGWAGIGIGLKIAGTPQGSNDDGNGSETRTLSGRKRMRSLVSKALNASDSVNGFAALRRDW